MLASDTDRKETRKKTFANNYKQSIFLFLVFSLCLIDWFGELVFWIQCYVDTNISDENRKKKMDFAVKSI